MWIKYQNKKIWKFFFLKKPSKSLEFYSQNFSDHLFNKKENNNIKLSVKLN